MLQVHLSIYLPKCLCLHQRPGTLMPICCLALMYTRCLVCGPGRASLGGTAGLFGQAAAIGGLKGNLPDSHIPGQSAGPFSALKEHSIGPHRGFRLLL